MAQKHKKHKEDIFDEAYQKPGLLFGSQPTKELDDFLNAYPISGAVLDIGCGDGRDTIPLLKRGFGVTALDRSVFAIEKLAARTDITNEMSSRLTTVVSDVRYWSWPKERYNLIVAVTLLDHLNIHDGLEIANRLIQATKIGGIVFAQVHTEEDPAVKGGEIVSEFAPAIKHYFRWNELIELFLSDVRILFYEDRLEWDYDHGTPHQHGFATLIGKRI